MSERKRLYLWDLPLDALTMRETLDWITRSIDTRRPVQHTVINAAKVIQAQRDSFLRNAIRESDLVNVDGQAVVWAARLMGIPVPERVAGVDLMWELLGVAEKKGYSVYFLGATDWVLSVLEERVRREFPDLRIAGLRNGYFSDDEAAGVADAVRAAGPDILYVGMPTPKKEKFIHAHHERIGVPFSMGVGGSFDVLAGKVSRAPVWVQRAGFEWAYRMAQEPRRLFKRYALTNAAFLRLVAQEVLKRQMGGGGGRR